MKLSQRRMSRPSLGGLMATRQGALALALLCAVCATGILVFALGQYKSGLKTQTQQATVLVATAEISQGTSISSAEAHGLYRAMPIVTSQLTPGALSDASFLAGKVAAVNILPGQQLTEAEFTTTVGIAGTLMPQQRAISISVSGAPGDTGIIQPGNRVDLYAQFVNKVNNQPFNVLVLRGALVLQSTVAAAAKGASSGAGNYVLQITAPQASDVIYAAQNGTLYTTLQPATKASRTPAPVTTLGSVVKADVQDKSNPGAHP